MVSEDLDALRRENARLEAILDGGLRQRLLTEFGAQHVAVGLKKQRGVVSDELVILAYVAEKLPPDEVPSGQLIPAEIDGVHTDVDVPKQFTFADSSKYRPVVGGIQITNGIEDFDSGGHLTMEGGTLGCLATNADGKTVLLSNWHVLSANSGKKGDAVYQPLPVHDGPPPSLGETPKRPTSSDNAIAKITDLQVSTDVDCGIATINTCYSLCCNCGVHFDNRIQGLAINSSDVITDVGVAVAGQQVVKVGSVTGRTVGKIRTLTAAPITIKRDGTNYTFTNQIEITPVSGPIFSDHGDSGAAIIGLTDGKIIGLLFATDADPSDPSTAANDINKVISALKITINVTKPAAPGFSSAALATRVDTEPDSLLEVLGARLSHTADGRALLAGLERHHDETIALVNDDRRVTVTWHRHHGPQWLAHAARQARHPGYELPETVDGVSLRELLLAMGDALTLAGSAPLIAEIARQRGRVERLPDHVTGVDDLFSIAVDA